MMIPPPHHPRPGSVPIHPRRVRAGIRLTPGGPAPDESWVAARWLALMRERALEATIAEGREYATLGQTRRLSIDPGRITASVQGRIIKAYDLTVTLPTFPHEAWEGVIAALGNEPALAARILAGELPPELDSLCAAAGLNLSPRTSDITATCSCPRHAPPGTPAPRAPSGGPGWCKHLCCLALLMAQRLAADPFLLLILRGIERDDLLERLRQRRAAIGSGPSGALIYAPHVAGASDFASPPLEAGLAEFWTLGPEIEAIDTPIQPPEVSHPLLRRLGPSPFTGPPGTRFPLVGLLATCYELVTEATRRAEEGEPPEDPVGGLPEDGTTPPQGATPEASAPV